MQMTEMTITDMVAFGIIGTHSSRILLFKQYLDEWFELPKGFLKSDYFKMWLKYVESPTESISAYTHLTEVTKMLLGESVHMDMLHCTRFYYRTQYLQKKHLQDIISKTYLM